MRDYQPIIDVPHPVQEHTKMQIPDKRYRTSTAQIFWGPKGASVLRPWFRPFQYIQYENLWKTSKAMK